MRGLTAVLQLLIGLLVVDCRTAYFWHITDFHLDVTYEPTEAACPYKWGGEGGKTTFGDYGCDASWSMVESALQFMRKKRGDNVEYVIWSGDSISNSTNYKSMDALAKATALFKHYFGTFFVIPVLGHNDNPTSDTKIHKYIGDLWKQWLPSEALQTFVTGGFYSIEQKNKPTIIVLNTNYMTANKDPFNQWKWLEKTLWEARRKKNVVYLFGHMPPGFVEPSRDHMPKCLMSNESNEKFQQIVENNSDIIIGQFFGHLHADTFRLFYNSTGYPISYGFVSPPITPRDYINPGFRLYKFEESTGRIMDYEQYYLDLRLANTNKKAEWMLEYSFHSYYNIKHINPFELNKLANSLGFSEESHVFELYLDAYSVKSNKQDCLVNTSWHHYCAITKLDKLSFNRCLSDRQRKLLRCPESHAIVLPQSSKGFQSSSSSQLIINMQILVIGFVLVFFQSN